MKNQLNLGEVLVRQAVRCFDLLTSVPGEYEEALYKQGGEFLRGADKFGHEVPEVDLQIMGVQAP